MQCTSREGIVLFYPKFHQEWFSVWESPGLELHAAQGMRAPVFVGSYSSPTRDDVTHPHEATNLALISKYHIQKENVDSLQLDICLKSQLIHYK